MQNKISGMISQFRMTWSCRVEAAEAKGKYGEPIPCHCPQPFRNARAKSSLSLVRKQSGDDDDEECRVTTTTTMCLDWYPRPLKLLPGVHFCWPAARTVFLCWTSSCFHRGCLPSSTRMVKLTLKPTIISFHSSSSSVFSVHSVTEIQRNEDCSVKQWETIDLYNNNHKYVLNTFCPL